MVDLCESIPISEDISCWKRDYTPGPLSEKEFEQFFHEGFVIKYDLFTPETLQPVIESIDRLVDELAEQLFQAV